MSQTRKGGSVYYDASDISPTKTEVYYDASDMPKPATPTRYAVIVSHNSRIQCLLAKIRSLQQRIRFQNCCVLKIHIYGNNIQVDLIHSGEITESDQKSSKVFYCAKGDTRLYNGNKFKPFTPIQTNDLSRLGIKVPLTRDYVFYLVRHGQSEHNESKLHIKLDTNLLNYGKQTVQNAASAIYRNVGDLRRFHMFFVSDLIRSRQTLDIMKRAWGWYDYDSYLREHLKDHPVRTIVLPCASEVGGVVANGDCDSSISITQKMARENYPSCTVSTISDRKNVCSEYDWSTYLDFYGKKMRGQEDTFTRFLRKTPRMKCRDTTLLAMAIYCLDYKQMPLTKFIGKPPSGGKTRRKR